MLTVVRAGTIPSEADVIRLLVTVVIVAFAAGVAVVVRPSWVAVVATVLGTLWWLWIGVDGPVLVGRGSHGVHLGDVPAVITGLAVLVSTVRLLRHR